MFLTIFTCTIGWIVACAFSAYLLLIYASNDTINNADYNNRYNDLYNYILVFYVKLI